MLRVAAAAVGALLMLTALVMLAWSQFGLMRSCDGGYYSPQHGRYVGNLEFDEPYDQP